MKYGVELDGKSFGTDTLTGGEGADTFVWTNASYSSPDNPDTIIDFSVSEGDVIDISGLIEGATFNVLGNASFEGQENQVIWRQGVGGDLAHTFIDIDFTGDNVADFTIKLENFTATDLTVDSFDFGSYVLSGTSGDDTITGSSTGEVIIGGYGGDTISGGGGDDIIYADNVSFTENSFGNLALWLDAADINADGTVASGDVSSWANRATGSNVGDADQLTADYQPTVTYNTASGRAGLAFDGNDYLQLLYDARLNSPEQTIFIIAEETGGAGGLQSVFSSANSDILAGYRFISNYNATYGFDIWYGEDGNGAGSGWYSHRTYLQPVTLDETQLLGSISYDGIRDDYLDGLATGPSLFAPNTSEDTYIGSGTSSNGVLDYFFNGVISEILIFDIALTDSQFTDVNQYLSLKYGSPLEYMPNGYSIDEYDIGYDTLTGGEGADTFVWTNASNSSPGTPDTITDFNVGEGDLIDINTVIDTASYNLIGNNAFSSQTNQIIWRQGTGGDSAHTFIDVDFGGDNVADFSIKLESFDAINLTSDSLILGSVDGTADDDVLRGADTDDTINGNAGDDTLIGGAGDDTLTGGDGNDTFTFELANGSNTVDGGLAGGYVDIIQLSSAVQGPIVSTTNPEDWTLTTSDSYTETADSIIFDNIDSDGTIVFGDGTQIVFTDIEKIQW